MTRTKRIAVLLASAMALSVAAVGATLGVEPQAAVAASTPNCNTYTSYGSSYYARAVPTYGKNGTRSCLLGYGNQSDGVGSLQSSLKFCVSIYAIGTVDGIFGTKTKSAVVTVQNSTRNGAKISPDGVYGPKTHNKIKTFSLKWYESASTYCNADPNL